jgi:hypothetical protein
MASVEGVVEVARDRPTRRALQTLAQQLRAAFEDKG